MLAFILIFFIKMCSYYKTQDGKHRTGFKKKVTAFMFMYLENIYNIETFG